ncbi:MAG: methylmalonyl-CoA mutase [Desulfobacterales bacterium SG8_35_2]|nr:MAG: methylmalonyl-CoA mutase [Desulfobacterales bacterium SG8_35_2]
MFENIEKIKKAKQEWLKNQIAKTKESNQKFMTASSDPVELLATPEDIHQINYFNDINLPGEFPYTRGIHPNMYRGKIWTMRQFAGFGTPRDTNQRFKYLLSHGQTGLSVAFDLPSLMGCDPDDPLSEGEVGKCGVSICSLKDMEILFDEIPLDQVSTSMTINGPAAMLYAFYLAVADKQGVPYEQLRGTIQNDILKEYIAQKEWIYPPKPSMRIIVDMIEFSTENVPQWNTVSISGYHIREAGSTAVQELAFTLADGFAYVEACLERGLDIDNFAPRLSHFFNSHNDFFEEIAKFRAARRIWARRMRDKYGAKDPRSWKLRFHTQTAGCTLTAQQPENNIVRVAYQALAGVLGGTQSLHTNSMDETLALPSEKAVTIALRTQQILAHETGVAYTVDPLGGSYYVEMLTNKMEAEAEKYFQKIDEMGGVIQGIENGYFQREIGKAAQIYQNEIDKNERIIVGVNKFVNPEENIEIPILLISDEVEQNQIQKLKELKETRDTKQVEETLQKLRMAAAEDLNLMPFLVEAAKTYCTLGEMVDSLKEVFGVYHEPAEF